MLCTSEHVDEFGTNQHEALASTSALEESVGSQSDDSDFATRKVSASSSSQKQRFCQTLANVVAYTPWAVIGTDNNDAALLLILDTLFDAVDFSQFLPAASRMFCYRGYLSV